MICVDIHHIDLEMKGVIVVVYYDGGSHCCCVPNLEGVTFECSNDPKFIKISEEMLLASFRKAVTDGIKGGKSLLYIFYHKVIYVGDGCVEYNSKDQA